MTLTLLFVVLLSITMIIVTTLGKTNDKINKYSAIFAFTCVTILASILLYWEFNY